MALTAGNRLGAYEIVALVGAGGMGEVYRARDTRLGRDVALKVLPEAFAADPDRVARFKREAQVLASLNHPNIAAIYGVESGPASAFATATADKEAGHYVLVLELVEGPTLADRIAEGPVPLDEALPIARQIADALEAAHEHGVIHRDLKPANIKLRPDGTVKVLDFGLAKAMDPELSGASASRIDVTASPTITSPAATRIGMILGTAAYMSPEQARGKPVDKRSDIWAFGCVLYEMLTGRRTFGGDEITDTLAFVITKEIDWQALPASTPADIRRLLRRCLEKDRKERLGDISLALLDIRDALAAPSAVTTGRSPAAGEGLARRSWVWAVGAVLVVALLASLPLALVHLRESRTEPEAIRFTVPAPEGGFFAGGAAYAPAQAVSPDGRQIVFHAQVDGSDLLWIRRLDGVDSRPLPGTEGGDFPFWSPDSRSIAFFAHGKLHKIDVATGALQTLADAPAAEGGAWNSEGVILYAPTGTSPLFRVAASGGQPERVTTLDASGSPAQFSHRWPHFLPDGRRFLYRAQPGNEIYLGSLDGRQPSPLLTADSRAMYMAPGYVLFVRRGTLFAQRFDGDREELAGDPVPVASDVLGNANNGRAAFSVSDSGVLAYRTGTFGSAQPTWFDRTGKRLGSVAQPADYRHVALAPDDSRAILHIHDDAAGGGGLWLLDLVRRTTSRLTFGSSHEAAGYWSPDGRDVLFDSAQDGGVSDLYRKSATGVGGSELWLKSVERKAMRHVSPDGRFLLYATEDPETLTDLWLLPLAGDRTPVSFLRTSFQEDHGRFSPDGRWIAYVSNETGRNEVYVQSTTPSGGKWQVSINGGAQPTWRSDGRELYFLSGGVQSQVMAVAVRSTASAFNPGVPEPLFRIVLAQSIAGLGINSPSGTYAVTRDGQRFLALTAPGERPVQPMTAVVNWTAGLPR